MAKFKPALSGDAIAIYVVLMTRREATTRDDLGTALGVQGPDDKALKALKDNGLLANGPRVGRKISYTLSRSGWARFPEVMRAGVAGRGPAANALLLLLKHISTGFEAHGISPEDFFKPDGSQPGDLDTADPVPPADTAQPGDAEALIRRAYRDLSRREGDWVPLADIRDRVGDFDAAAVDRALVALGRQHGVLLIPWDNRKALSDRDRAAAIRFGGTDAHALRIESA